MRKGSQMKDIKTHLRRHKSISSLEAINKYGATRLSDIIFRLRNRGWVIQTETVNGKNRYGNITNYALYHLIQDVKDGDEEWWY